ncbi:shikimate dehydrogenase [Candidatus Peregrinibacteria bacterium CG_4_9_14_0_2_um_filter_53_11]|nr:MAG: shikimate dehydrogenase [Candidatus Peregrinibacteria bacterium CG_4_9_14_0_2_um_filter_53_11]
MDRYCVIGYPVEHSRSPELHNAAFKAAGLAAQYEAVSVPPEKLGAFMAGFKSSYSGANVTIPHKEKIIPFLDALSETAQRIGAVNTIVNESGSLIGYNTDCSGALGALAEAMGRASDDPAAVFGGRRALVLGAGGAARALIYGLTRAGAEVTVLNRTPERARRLAEEFGCSWGALDTVPPISDRAEKAGLIINTTSVGMDGETTPAPWLGEYLAASAHTHGKAGAPLPVYVMDSIYTPELTPFLRQAQQAGAEVVFGRRMFLKQAADAFELWTGRPMPEIELNEPPAHL